MKYSVFYRIEHRDDFYEKMIKKMSMKLNEDDVEVFAIRFNELMEYIVSLLLNNDKYNLYDTLISKNSVLTRKIFNYLTCSNIRGINKDIIRERINEIIEG